MRRGAGESAPVRPVVRPLSRLSVMTIQCAIVTGILLIWENADQLPVWGGNVPFLDPFFISSPSRVWEEFGAQLGADGSLASYLWTTVRSALLGTLIGFVAGACVGLLLSNNRRLAQVLRPFLVALNATPRVALVPIIVIVTGPTFRASVISVILVVFFVAFFNAYEGGRTVPSHMVQNVQLLGAGRLDIMRLVRFPYVLAWTFAALPLAITFGLITVVTTEILTGYPGIGRLIVISLTTSRSSLTFVAVISLSAVGLAIVMLAETAKRRVLHWWEATDLGSG